MTSPAAEIAALALVRVRAAKNEPPRRPLFPHQIPPTGEWNVWLLLGGRGSGKTEAGARYVDQHARGPACLEGATPHRIAIVAPSHDDAVDTCVRGETGLLQVNTSIRFRPGAQLAADLTWPNGAEAELFGTFAPEDVERFRGPQHCLIWGDEFAAWRKLDESWDMIQFGLRLGAHPHMVLTTTPKRRAKLKELIARSDTVVSRARTADNPGLPEQRRAALYEQYGGTTIGRQELDAELLDDIPGALWSRAIIDGNRRPPIHIKRNGELVPDFARVVVALDPAATSGDASDETGIIVAALGNDGRGYVLSDLSGRFLPTEWARRAWSGYEEHKADRMVAEANNGGEMVEAVIRQIAPKASYRAVHASRGKRTRAEPVAALYEQGKVSHVDAFPELEDQLCTYTGAPGEESPDRLDALVWALTDLMLGSVSTNSDTVSLVA